MKLSPETQVLVLKNALAGVLASITDANNWLGKTQPAEGAWSRVMSASHAGYQVLDLIEEDK